MKKITSLLLLGITFFLFTSSCKKNTAVPVQNVQNLNATPGYGSVMLSWTFPNDSSYLYVSVSYTDTAGKVIEQKFSKYADTAVIGNLQSKPYTFNIQAVGVLGGVSQAQSVTATPNPPIYTEVSPTLTISPGFGSAKIKWKNVTGQTLGIQVSYIDSTGTQQVVSDTSSNAADSLVISGLPNVQSNFTVVLSDVYGSQSAPQSLTTTPLKEVKIDKSNWTITADSQEEFGEPSPNGWATAAIDNNINTYWHSEWLNAQPGYPHWLAVDMHQEVTISRIELTPRQGHRDGFKTFDIDGSDDGIHWTTYESNLSLIQENNTQSFAVPSNPTVRYIRIYMTSGASFYAHLAELSVYGGE